MVEIVIEGPPGFERPPRPIPDSDARSVPRRREMVLVVDMGWVMTRWNRTPMVCLLACATGCVVPVELVEDGSGTDGGPTDEPTGSSTNLPPASTTNADQLAAIEALVEARCGAYEACACPTSLGEVPPWSCEGDLRGWLEDGLAMAQGAGLRFDAECFDQLVAFYTDQGCVSQAEWTQGLDHLASLRICVPFVGDLAEGEECTLSSSPRFESCGAGLSCVSVVEAGEVLLRCVDPSDLGEPCSGSCLPGLACDHGDTETCVSLPLAGEPCLAGSDRCGTETTCDAGTGLCVAKNPEGVACSTATPESCASGHCLPEGTCSGPLPAVCLPRLPL